MDGPFPFCLGWDDCSEVTKGSGDVGRVSVGDDEIKWRGSLGPHSVGFMA